MPQKTRSQSLMTGIPIITIWGIGKEQKKMESVKRKWRSGHIKAISNKNLSILVG